MNRKRISYHDRYRSLTLVRQDDPDGIGRLNVAAARGALQRVDRAFQAFFRRCKEGGTPGYPRFRSAKRYTTIEINDVTPSQVRRHGNHLVVRINGVPTIRVRQRPPAPDDKPRAIRITRRPTGCTVDLVHDVEIGSLEPTGESVGIDLGVRKRLTLSTGETIAPEHEDWQAIRRTQRAIARCRRGSNRRRKRLRGLARRRRRAAVRRRNACHRISTALVRSFDTIAIEDLALRNMTRSARGTREAPGRNVRQKQALNRCILEQAWGTIVNQLAYKAACAGRRLVRVDPRHTSQDCSGCGTRRAKPETRERWSCAHCGQAHDRDVNAATNIHRAGIRALGSQSGERVAA